MYQGDSSVSEQAWLHIDVSPLLDWPFSVTNSTNSNYVIICCGRKYCCYVRMGSFMDRQ